jgi:hypothetical protein
MKRIDVTVLGDWSAMRDQGIDPTSDQLLFATKAYRTWSAFDRPGKKTALEIVCEHTGITPDKMQHYLKCLEQLEAREAAEYMSRANQRKIEAEKRQKERQRLEKSNRIAAERWHKARDKERLKMEREKKKEELKQKKIADKAAAKAKAEAAKAKLIGSQSVTLQLGGATITGTASAIAVILAKLESKQ